MTKFCSNCGSEINENADICLNCGVMVNKNNNSNNNNSNSVLSNTNYNKQKVPGKGLSIAGMVLGIIAAVWALISLISIGNIESELTYGFYYVDSSYIIGFAIGYTLFSLVPSIIGLILSAFGFRKLKSGINITGLILSIIAFVIAIIEFIYILTFI